MERRIVIPGLLALLLVASGAPAQAPSTSTVQPPAQAVDPGAIEALKEMGSYLQTLKRFRVSTEFSGERVLKDGQKLQHTAKASLDVARPTNLRARISSVRTDRELFYDGKSVTLYAPAQKYYSTAELTGTIADLIDGLEDKYGVEFPLADLFRWGTPAATFDKFDSAMYAGQDLVGKDLCDHYAFRRGKLDWQIWIDAGSNPLPRKVVITNRGDEARPQSVSVITWNLKPAFEDSTFRFKPPQGATKVDFVPRKTK